MDVSVIFATHNRADIIGQVLGAWRVVDSVTKYEYEIICSDDASEDETVEIIKRATDLPIHVIQNEKGGASKARNAALEIARGEVIIFTGDDIFPDSNFVNAHYENYLKYGAQIATLGRIEWHSQLKLNQLMYHITNVGCEQFGFIGLPPYQLIDFRHFYTSNISVSKKMLDKAGAYFKTDFDKYGFEDVEFGYRLQKCGMKIFYDPGIVAMHYHIYDDVDRFCIRQMNAGEELVVFQRMHDDLEDKCICDTDNCRQAFEKYLQTHHNSRSVQGCMIRIMIGIAKKITTLIEKISHDGKLMRIRKFASVIYAGIFKFYFYYGCVCRIAQDIGVAKSKRVQFTYLYLKKSYSQIYFDTGAGYSEDESRKWVCWDDKEWQIEKTLPDNVKEIRFSPLKNRCRARILDVYFVCKGEIRQEVTVQWHNSRNGSWRDGDYTHTNDPQIIISDIPDDAEKLVVRMQVKNMKKHNLIGTIKKAAIKLYRRQMASINAKKGWKIEYASGQPRKIQLIIESSDSGEIDASELAEQYNIRIGILGDNVVVSESGHTRRGYSNYLYKPLQEPLDVNQIFQVLYALMNCVCDYVIVSKAYTEYPQIAAKCLEDIVIYSDLLVDQDGIVRYQSSMGRYMRLPSYRIEKQMFNVGEQFYDITSLDGYLSNKRNDLKPEFRMSAREFGYIKKKPLVFVFPIFLAVGGVERNTIEVMRALKDRYEFCVVTMEKHTAEQGSLHYQLEGICDYIFDLKEMVDFEHYLDVLYELKQMFNPDVLWLCNNSPWFEAHTLQIRELYKNIPIVAQDVYDTKEGWIEYYNTVGVKSFDRYIAITELIRECFVEKYGIENDRIDVIYPVVDAEKVERSLYNQDTYEQICNEYGLNINAQHYSYIARLSAQKNPVRYLKLVQAVYEKYGDSIQFIMVGDGSLSYEVEQYIKENHMEDMLVQIPYIDDIPHFMRILDGLIITSYYEGMPIVSIEAMSMGIPVLSTDAGDLRRFISQTQGGLIMNESLSDLQNFEMFKNNLLRYTENAKLHADKIKEFFSADIVAQKYVDAFEKAMNKYR